MVQGTRRAFVDGLVPEKGKHEEIYCARGDERCKAGKVGLVPLPMPAGEDQGSESVQGKQRHVPVSIDGAGNRLVPEGFAQHRVILSQVYSHELQPVLQDSVLECGYCVPNGQIGHQVRGGGLTGQLSRHHKAEKVAQNTWKRYAHSGHIQNCYIVTQWQ